MEDPPVATRSSRWPLILWGLTTLAMFSLAQAQDRIMAIVINEYRNAEMKALPSMTEIVVKCRSALWALPVVACLSGLPFVLKADLEKVKLWTLVILLLVLIHASMMSVALFSPFMRIICRLQ